LVLSPLSLSAPWIASAGWPAHIPTAAEIPRFVCQDVAVATWQEILIVRATPPPPEEVVVEENPFILPALTAPALLETNLRPKRARGPTLDYKAMHEGS
jgi:hypothetical protein